MDTPLLNHLTSDDYNHVYEPAEDSFLLLDALEDDLDELRQMKPSVCVELGSGSGINVTALARALPNSHCIGVDINPYACRTTARTALANGASVDVINMDLLSCLQDGVIDLLIFNPPYVPTDSLVDDETFHDPSQMDNQLVKSWSGGRFGCDVIFRLFEEVYRKLNKGSVFYLLLLKENDPEDIRRRLLKLNFTAELCKERKIRGEHLFIMKIKKN